MIKINYKSDFKINESSETVAMEVPFVFSYYVFDRKKYVVSFDGHNYVNCERKEDGSLDVIFNQPEFGIGHLKVERKYAIDDKAFADGVFDVVTVDKTDVFITSGQTFETYVKTLVVPPYIKGDKGDPMTWETMTEKERGELVKDVAEAIDPEMVMTENEKSRQEAERSRQTAEQQRSTTFNTLKGEMLSAITAGNAAAGNAQKVVDEYDTKVAEQDGKLSELGREFYKLQSNFSETDSDDNEQLEIVNNQGKSIVKVDNTGVHIDDDKLHLNGEYIGIDKDDSEDYVEIENEDGKVLLKVSKDGLLTSRKVRHYLNCNIIPNTYIRASTGELVGNSNINIYTVDVRDIGLLSIDLGMNTTNGLAAYVGMKEKTVVVSEIHEESYRKTYHVRASGIDTIYINVPKSGDAKVFTEEEVLTNDSINGFIGLFLGDSLVYGIGAPEGYDAVSCVETKIKCKCLNGGVGGTTMCDDGRGVNLYKIITSLTDGNWDDVDTFINQMTDENIKSVLQRRFQDIKKLTARDVNFVFISYGTNDWYSGRTLYNKDNDEDVTTVCGSLRYAVRKIIEWHPAIPIFVVTPGFRMEEIESPSVNGVSMREFCDKIKDTCIELHIPCWNQYYNNGVNKYNAHYYMPDGTHRNVVGYELLGQQYANFIFNNINKEL